MKRRILYKINVIIALLFLLNNNVWSQKEKDLKKLHELQKEDTEPAFSTLSEPEKYKKESMVMLAEKLKVVQAKIKTINNGYAYFDQYFVYSRTRIKLNDLNAIEAYSDFEFEDGNEFEVKIVKPDGKKIDVDLKDAVDADNLKTSNKFFNKFLVNKRKKIAIKNLEIGDIIDYSSLYRSSSYLYRSIYFTNITGMPIVYLKNEFKVNKNNTVVAFKNFNGAKTLIQKADGKLINYSFESNLIDKRKEEIMSDDYQSDPYYKLDIYFDVLRYYPLKEKPAKNAIKSSLTEEEIKKHVYNVFRYSKLNSNNYLEFIKSENVYGLSDEDYIKKYYYFCRENLYRCSIAFNFEQKKYGVEMLNQFISHLEKRDIKYELLAMVSKEDGTIKDLINTEDFSYGIRFTTDGNEHFLTMFNANSQLDDISEEFDNTEAYAFSNYRDGVSKLEMNVINMPKANHKDNIYTINIDGNFNTNDSLVLNVLTEATGFQRSDSRFNLINAREYLKLYNKELERKKAITKNKKLYYFTNLNYYGANQALLDKEEERILKDHYDKLEKYKRENLENDARNEYYVLRYEKFEPINDGRSIKNTTTSWKEKFIIGNTLIPAGKSFVFEIGKVLGRLSMISDNDDRVERTKPFFIDYNKTFTMNVKIKIPDGKTVSGLESLIVNETNKVGSIISTAKIENGYIVWSFTKKLNSYKFEAVDWSNYIKITDLGMNLNTSKIIIN